MNYDNYLGAIFDCDGTILESMEMWRGNASRIVKHFGLEPTPNLDDVCINLCMRDTCTYINNQFKINITVDELSKLSYELVKDEYENNLMLKTKAKELLDKLKDLNYKMIVATATPSDMVKICLKRLGILDYFVDVISVRDYNTTKRVSKIYDIALEKIGVSKEKCLVFEDAIYAIKTCLDASYNVVVIKDKTQSDELNEILPKTLGLVDLS